jgi:pilus assembly protein Flp/PilA
MLKYYFYFMNWLKREEGQDLIEYALLTFLIALAAVVALTALGTNIGTVFTSISTKLTTASGGTGGGGFPWP